MYVPQPHRDPEDPTVFYLYEQYVDEDSEGEQGDRRTSRRSDEATRSASRHPRAQLWGGRSTSFTQITHMEDASGDSLGRSFAMSETAVEARPAWEWRAMGATSAGAPLGEGRDRGRRRARRCDGGSERRWSRFIARSEVSRLEPRCPGVPLQATTETPLDLLLSCDRWHERADSAFSVMVGGALHRVRLPREPVRSRARWKPAVAHCGRGGRSRRSAPPGPVRRAPALDLGGVARMWSAERAAAMVRTLSDDPAILLEVGDDMVAVRGDHLVAVSGVDSNTGRWPSSCATATPWRARRGTR